MRRKYILKDRPKHTGKPAKIMSERAKSKSNRGRRSKEKEREILTTHGGKVADIFRLEPLREPVDSQFAPYYAQVLEGNARAIIEYCDKFWEQGQLAGSFFELLGRLFTLRFYEVADTILRNIEHRHTAGWPSERKSYEYWYRKLKPLCSSARDFIKDALKSNPSSRREQLWNAYIERPAWEIRNEDDRQLHRQRQEAIQTKLPKEPNSVSEEADEQSRKPVSMIVLVQSYGSFNLVPKGVFFELASTKFNAGDRRFRLTPSEVARKYACIITDLSESTVSHWASQGK